MKSANGKNRGARLVLILLAALLAGMSLREKVCQMLIVAPSDPEPRTVRTVEPEMEEALAAYPVGVLSEARIDESVLRILALKEGQGLLP